MTEALDALRSKLGPLPAWAWGTIAAVGIVGGRSLLAARKAKAETPATGEGAGAAPPAETPATPSMSGTVPSLFPATPAGGAYDPTTDYPSTPAATAPPNDNETWRGAGERWALDNLQWSGLVISSALQKYLSGSPLSSADVSIVNSVIRAIGPAPQGAPELVLQPNVTPGNAPADVTPAAPVTPAPAAPPPTTTVAAPPPPAPVAAETTHTIKAGETLIGIVRARYPGVPVIAKVNEIAAINGLKWNAAHTMVTPFRVGQILRLP